MYVVSPIVWIFSILLPIDIISIPSILSFIAEHSVPPCPISSLGYSLYFLKYIFLYSSNNLDCLSTFQIESLYISVVLKLYFNCLLILFIFSSSISSIPLIIYFIFTRLPEVLITPRLAEELFGVIKPHYYLQNYHLGTHQFLFYN